MDIPSRLPLVTQFPEACHKLLFYHHPLSDRFYWEVIGKGAPNSGDSQAPVFCRWIGHIMHCIKAQALFS